MKNEALSMEEYIGYPKIQIEDCQPELFSQPVIPITMFSFGLKFLYFAVCLARKREKKRKKELMWSSTVLFSVRLSAINIFVAHASL